MKKTFYTFMRVIVWIASPIIVMTVLILIGFIPGLNTIRVSVPVQRFFMGTVVALTLNAPFLGDKLWKRLWYSTWGKTEESEDIIESEQDDPTGETWKCKKCGAVNSRNYGQCKKCGVYRSQSL